MRTLLASVFFGLFLTTSAFSNDIPEFNSPDPTVNGVFQVSANWSTLKRGWNVLTLRLTDADGNKLDNASLELDYDMTSMPMDPPKAEVKSQGTPGLYETRVFFGMRGQYRFDFKVAAGDKSDSVTLYQTIK